MSESKQELRAGYTRNEYVELYYLSNASITKVAWCVMLTLVWTAVAFGAVYAALFGLPEDINLVLLLISAAVLVFAAVYLPLYPSLTKNMVRKHVDREYLSGDRRDNTKTIVVSRKGLEVFSFGAGRMFSWNRVEKVREDRTHILFLYQGGETLLLPKDCMEEETLRLLRERSGCKVTFYP